MEAVGVVLGYLLDGLTLGQRRQDHLVPTGFHQLLAHVPHIGNVLDVVDFETVRFQGAPYPVSHEVGSQIAYVGVSVDRGATGVHPYQPRFDGLDFFHLLGEGVVEP